MKNSVKNLFKKTSTFFKKGVNSFKNTFKKYPKTMGFLLVALVFIPIITIEAGKTTTTAKGILAFLGIGAAIVNGVDIIIWVLTVLKSLAATIVYASGLFFDNLLIITLSREMYDADWIKLGWSLIRDIANIAFILGIVVIGIFMIIGKTEWKKMLINLIIVVFVMNFSMFFARVIIDAGNFTAAIFYSMSSVEEKNTANVANGVDTLNLNLDLEGGRLFMAKAILGKEDGWDKPYFGSRSIATGLIAFVNPTELYSAGEDDLRDKNESGIKQTLIILNIVFILVMIWMSKALVKASFMFVSRTIHLIKLIISAPVYFAWYFLPSGSGKLNEWFGEIIGKAFCVTSYMIGLWLLFLFLANETMVNALDGDGISEAFALIALVGIKFLIIYMSLEKLTEMGSKNCESGDFGKGFADNIGKLTSFVGGGALLKGGSFLAKNSARSMIGAQGQAFRERASKWGESKTKLGRWIGDSMLAGGNTLYDAKIGGQSFKDEVDKRQKREGEMLNMMTKKQQEERFYNQQGGKNAQFVGTKEKREEVAKELVKLRKERNTELENIRRSGGTEEEVKVKIQEFKQKNDEKIEKFKQDNINVISTSQEKFNKMNNESEKIKYINQNPQGLKETKSVMSQLMGTAEHEEAANQVLGKKSVESKLKREKDALKKKDEKIRQNYIEKESEINNDLIDNKERLSTVEKRNVSSMKDLADKFREMYDVIGEGNKMIGEDGRGLSDEQVLEYVSDDKKFSSNNESLLKLKDREFREGYVDSKEVLKGKKEELELKKNRLAMEKAKSDIQERDEFGRLTQRAKEAKLAINKQENEIRDSEKTVSNLEKNIAKTEADIKKGFDKAKDLIKSKADSEKKVYKEEYSDKKAENNEKKSTLNKEATQVKDNIAAGIHTHNPNRHNVNTVITAVD